MQSQNQPHHKKERDYDVFHETLAPTADDYLMGSYTAATSIVQLVASVLNGLLIIRFFISLFSADRSIPLLNLVYGFTDWLVSPFAGLASISPLSGTTYIDWPAIVAIVLVSVISGLLVRLTSAPRV